MNPALRKILGESRQQTFALLRAILAALLELDDVGADEPVAEDEALVDCRRCAPDCRRVGLGDGRQELAVAQPPPSLRHGARFCTLRIMEPRTMPAYSLSDAARCIGAHPATLRSWFKGRSYPTKDGPRRSPNLLVPAAADALSFQNLIQAHVVQGIRKRYHIPMHRVRDALKYLTESVGSLDLLASEKFYHDTEHLLLKVEDRLISLSERGQTVSETVLQQYLHRIDYGKDGFASRLHPFLYTATGQLYEPRHIMIDPTIAFGKPCIERLGVKTDIIAERFLAGEPIEELSADYGAEPEEIQEAIRWSARKAA